MVEWYRHNIPRWRGGTASLEHEEYRLFHVICEQIYWEEEDILPHIRSLAGLANMSERLARKTLDRLVVLGKLSVSETGRVSQTRTKVELNSVMENRRNAGTGGKVSGERRRKASKLNGSHEAPLQEGAKHPMNRGEESRVEKKDSCSSGDERFDEFWNLYPKKAAKKKAMAAYAKALRETSPETIIKALRAQLPTFKPGFIPYPASWLNAGQWEDELQLGSQPDDWKKVAFG